jgi:hypothetical protein
MRLNMQGSIGAEPAPREGMPSIAEAALAAMSLLTYASDAIPVHFISGDKR